ncbi:hypothetical protein B0H65DRAFT_575564 [Neurospora tetraspora]|uniref:Uncharacterized protein n=1 Tax=Neurospora tetraspora TaxID=94610 RepID=A0AAE0JCR5_9PEZI|nr:hypothetical protein B0H65DRAFT_575564 [Neurospora tetraspora]
MLGVSLFTSARNVVDIFDAKLSEYPVYSLQAPSEPSKQTRPPDNQKPNLTKHQKPTKPINPPTMCKYILLPGVHVHDWTPTNQQYAGVGARCSHAVEYKKRQEVTYDSRFCQCDTVVEHDPQANGRSSGLASVGNVQVPCATCRKKEPWAKNHGTTQNPIED